MVLPLIGIAASLAAEFAPGIIKHLAGDKAGEVAEQVVGIAQKATGQGSPDAALEALRADPQAVLAFKSEMATLEIEAEKAYLADRQNARQRDTDLKKMGYRNTRADIMIFMAFVCVCFISYMIFDASTIKPEILAIFNMALGYLFKMLSDAFQFEFGSSRGSKEKDVLQR